MGYCKPTTPTRLCVPGNYKNIIFFKDSYATFSVRHPAFINITIFKYSDTSATCNISHDNRQTVYTIVNYALPACITCVFIFSVLHFIVPYMVVFIYVLIINLHLSLVHLTGQIYHSLSL